MQTSLAIAGIGSRAWAFIIDWHIRVLLFALSTLLSWMLLGLPSEPVTSTFLLGVLLYLLYHPLLEWRMRGETIGKRLVGVRLVTKTGKPPGFVRVLLRNLLRIVDSFPMIYGLGLLVCFCNRRQIRIGDWVAGTVLIVHDELEIEP